MTDFLFLDLETTGLDPKRCRIIEVACVLTRDDFVPYAEFERVVFAPTSELAGCWDKVARDMHRASGLLICADETPDDNTSASFALQAWLRERLGDRRANLAGNSVHFDRSFLAEQWPGVVDHLTHRHLDVSSLRLLGEARGLPRFEGGERAHRAMADVRHSLAELAHWTRELTGPI